MSIVIVSSLFLLEEVNVSMPLVSSHTEMLPGPSRMFIMYFFPDGRSSKLPQRFGFVLLKVCRIWPVSSILVLASEDVILVRERNQVPILMVVESKPELLEKKLCVVMWLSILSPGFIEGDTTFSGDRSEDVLMLQRMLF